ncbi:hypothetical protein K0E75_21010, partial [Bacteroides fragilis]|nr:hypothetical protein [Bacteroides fragilis]MCE8594043.1 hypothetical protein [Bacteroides fragilis]
FFGLFLSAVQPVGTGLYIIRRGALGIFPFLIAHGDELPQQARCLPEFSGSKILSSLLSTVIGLSIRQAFKMYSIKYNYFS